MRYLLINPPDTRPAHLKGRVGICPPLGLAYLAAVLEKRGHEVKILDCLVHPHTHGTERRVGYNTTPSWYRIYGGDMRFGLDDWEVEGHIKKFKPDVVGVTCPFSARHEDALAVCRIAKVIDSKIFTVVGGAHPSCVPQEFISDKSVDCVVQGEGEVAIARALRPRIMKAPFIKDLDSLPFPARHLLDMDKYLWTDSPHSGYKERPFTNMITSRGCPNRCGFCVIRKVWGNRVRYRSPESVLAEIRHLVETYGIKEIQFEDDNFLSDRERATQILAGIKNNYQLSLSSPSGLAVNTLDEVLLTSMYEAGYYSVSLAIESGSERTLRLMHKPVHLHHARQLVTHCHKIGLRVKGFFILGYPGETKDDMRKTVDFAASLGLDWAIFFIATPIPGSDLYSRCHKNGWLANPGMSYVETWHKANIRTPEFDPEYVEELKEQANREINFENNYNMRIGNYEQAREDFQAVVDHCPDLDFAQEALQNAMHKIKII